MARKRANTLRPVPRPDADDFTSIRGIGPVTEKRLYEAGIHTLDQLAALTPESIAAILPSLSAQKIVEQKWIDQARQLCPDKKKSGHSQKETAPAASRQHYENFTLEFLLDGKNKIRRMQLIYVQNGDTDTWTRWDPERLIDFLARHTGLRLPYAKLPRAVMIEPKPVHQSLVPAVQHSEIIVKETTAVPFDASSETRTPAPVSPVEEIRHEIPEATGLPGVEAAALISPLPTEVIDPSNKVSLLDWKTVLTNTDQPVRHLSSTQAFDVHLTIDLTRTCFPDTSSLDIRAELYARKMGHATRQMVAETQITKPCANIVCLALRNAALPQGLYRLEAVLAINPTGMSAPDRSGMTAAISGGMIQVY